MSRVDLVAFRVHLRRHGEVSVTCPFDGSVNEVGRWAAAAGSYNSSSTDPVRYLPPRRKGSIRNLQLNFTTPASPAARTPFRTQTVS